MSRISLTTDNQYDQNFAYVSEGDAIRLVFNRDDSSHDETFYLKLNSFGGDPSHLFTGIDPDQPITVHFAAGDTEPQVVTIQTADDTQREASSSYASFSLIPAEGSDLTFDVFGTIQDHIALGIEDDDTANITVSIANPHGTMATAIVDEGTDLTFSFTRTDGGSGEVSFELRPADYDFAKASAEQYFGYDPDHPLTVHFADGETGTQTLTLHALDDYSTTGPGAFAWTLVPIAGVTGFSGLEDRPNANPQTDGSLALLVDFQNNDQPTVGMERFYAASTGDHFYTSNADEAAALKAAGSGYSYEGTGFQAMEAGQEGADAVFRFYSATTGDHFFTASTAERDMLMSANSGYQFEGTGFHAATADGEGLTEVYRFYSADTGDHFYTSDVGEKAAIEANIPSYHYEGVAFYVPEHAVIA